MLKMLTSLYQEITMILLSLLSFYLQPINIYKNKFITTVRDILSDPDDSKTSLEILEEAIANIGLSKRQSISIFDNLLKIIMEKYSLTILLHH